MVTAVCAGAGQPYTSVGGGATSGYRIGPAGGSPPGTVALGSPSMVSGATFWSSGDAVLPHLLTLPDVILKSLR